MTSNVRKMALTLTKTLTDFNAPATIEAVHIGAAVTQFALRPGHLPRVVNGTKTRTPVRAGQIIALADDIAVALRVQSVRVGLDGGSISVEVPNEQRTDVTLRAMMARSEFVTERQRAALPVALGETLRGAALIVDVAKLPHLLIAGSTGSGKSVCVNSIITSLLATQRAADLRLMLVDPKVVELSVYNGIPHLLQSVVTEPDAAAAALDWAVNEMERRYQALAAAGVRDIASYNKRQRDAAKRLPYIVFVIDELADLMMVAKRAVEAQICRLAQKARAVGIHLIVATQRPSVNVITGLIKANFPSRIAFAVASQTDSRVILDACGAETLLGRGDMLFLNAGTATPQRAQGAHVSDAQIAGVVSQCKKSG